MKYGRMYEFGDVVLAQIQFIDTFEVKTRPALVLFEENNNIVVAGITSNLDRKGIRLTKKDGMIKESIIMLNYVFTISRKMVKKSLFIITSEKKRKIKNELIKKLGKI
jgi:hypothetical protein